MRIAAISLLSCCGATRTVEGLESSATVLGLFETWSCSIAERQLVPGDALALYYRRHNESANDEGEEFGEPRLIEGLERHRELPAEALLASVVDEVRQFSSGDQQDDITRIIAKCRQVLRRSSVTYPATPAESLYSPRLDHRAA